MRNINTIAAEIVELSEIKSSYNFFLASHKGQADVENYTYISQNKAVVSGNLRKLYVELYEAKGRRDKRQGNSQKEVGTSQQPRATSEEKGLNNKQTLNNELHTNENPTPHTRNPQPNTLRMKFEPYHATEAEQRAILLFNSDRRYSITE